MYLTSLSKVKINTIDHLLGSLERKNYVRFTYVFELSIALSSIVTGFLLAQYDNGEISIFSILFFLILCVLFSELTVRIYDKKIGPWMKANKFNEGSLLNAILVLVAIEVAFFASMKLFFSFLFSLVRNEII